MTRQQLTELGYIVPLATVPLILAGGILSHKRASKVAHTSIASNEVQDIRAGKTVPGGRPLHDYANLYICPRNPMLYVKKAIHQEICILRVDPNVVDIPNAVVTDTNAARTFARFRPSPAGLAIVDYDLTFARFWTHQDPQEYYRRKGLKCAEVLVPDAVPRALIMGAYVSCTAGEVALSNLAVGLSVTVNSDLFFL